MRIIGEVATFAAVIALVAGLAVGVSSIPDIKRYLRMRQM
ncbi:DUF6893 family small protein [Antrihabitans cavernicola]